VGQHLAPGGQDLAHHLGRRAAVAQLHRRLDHRQGEPLHPIAVETQVALFRLGQTRLDGRGVAVVVQQVDEPGVGQTEDRLVVPEGVVGIEADRGDGHGRGPQDFAAALGPRVRRTQGGGDRARLFVICTTSGVRPRIAGCSFVGF